MLRYRPRERASARVLLQHPWIEQHCINGRRDMHSVENATCGRASNATQMSRTASESSKPIASHVRFAATESERPRAHALQEETMRNKPKRIPSENSPVPPRLAPESLALVTERRREKFHKKLARLLPIYRAPHVGTPLLSCVH